MNYRNTAAGVIALALVASTVLLGPCAYAEPLIWGIQAEQLEYRTGEGSDILAWDFNALVGTDELKFFWRSEAEYALNGDVFETFENQARLQMPISDFFDGVADDPLKAASEAVGNKIAASLSDDGEGQLIGMDRS